jgi:hypothetical protein
MPPGTVYHILPVPDEHQKTVQAITDMICLEDRIEYAFPLLTNAELSQELVINASNLPEISEWLTVSFAVSLEKATLEPLVSQFSNILIIPLWRINLDGAIHVGWGAAYHLVEPLVERESVNQYLPAEHFCERAEQTGVSAEQARLDLLTDAMLEVVKHANQRMFIKSVKDSQLLRYPDGRPEIGAPNDIDEYTLWRWAESEAVRKAEALLYECPYQPELTIEAIPRDRGPVRLLFPFSGESRVRPRGAGGAPHGPRYFPTKDDLVLAVATAIEDQRKRNPGGQVTRDKTAAIMFRRLGRRGRHGEHSNPGSVLLREAHEWGIEDWADLRSRAEALIKRQQL